MKVFASVAALCAFSITYKAEILEDMILNKKTRPKLEKFLSLKICTNTTSGTNHYKRKEYVNQNYKRRLYNNNGDITPAWEVFASREDLSRSREYHLEVIQRLRDSAKPLGQYDDSGPISEEPPDPQALTAVLNIIHSINPRVEFTKVSGNPWKKSRSSYSQKTTGNFVHMQSGRKC